VKSYLGTTPKEVLQNMPKDLYYREDSGGYYLGPKGNPEEVPMSNLDKWHKSQAVAQLFGRKGMA
jgi:hypothetical protein